MASAPRHARSMTCSSTSRTTKRREFGDLVTESTLGGAGVVQAFADRFSAEPRIFFNALEASLAATDLELVDDGLRRVIALTGRDAEVAEKLARLRAAEGHREFEREWREVSGTLVRRGMTEVGHALTVSLTSRLLRAGGGRRSMHSCAAARALDRTELEQASLWGFANQLRLREGPGHCRRSQGIPRTPARSRSRARVRHRRGYELLWPRTGEVRLRSLRSYNPYRGTKTTDPALVRRC